MALDVWGEKGFGDKNENAPPVRPGLDLVQKIRWFKRRALLPGVSRIHCGGHCPTGQVLSKHRAFSLHLDSFMASDFRDSLKRTLGNGWIGILQLWRYQFRFSRKRLKMATKICILPPFAIYPANRQTSLPKEVRDCLSKFAVFSISLGVLG